MSNKRKRTTKPEAKTKKIDSYFKPVQAEVPVLDSPTFKKVKLKTRTLRKQHLVSSDSDLENKQDARVGNLKKGTEEEKEEKEEGDSKALKVDKDEEQGEEQREEEEEKDDKVESNSQIKTTQTQELDTQNVPIFSTQTQTQTDTMIGSPITYTIAEDDDEEEDCFFELPKLIDSQIETKKEGPVLSSTQESSLDDFDDNIFNDEQQNDVNVVVSLEDDILDFSQNDPLNKISSNLPDTNLSFPSSTL